MTTLFLVPEEVVRANETQATQVTIKLSLFLVGFHMPQIATSVNLQIALRASPLHEV